MIRDYLYAIGKYLPVSDREDILQEIEGGIYDYLKAEFGKKEYTEDEIKEALIKMGNPKKVAYAYTKRERHLIDPLYLDIYFLILKVGIFGLSIAFIVIGILSLINSNSLLRIAFNFLSNIWQAGLMMVGIVTLIFAAISKFPIENKKIDLEDEEWSLKDLEKAPVDINLIKISDIVIESIFIILFLTFLNTSTNPKYDGYLVALNSQAFSKFIIWFNLSLIFNLALNIYLLLKKEWSNISRVLSMVSDFIGVFIFGVLAFKENLIDFSKIPQIPTDLLRSLEFGISIGFKIGFFAVLIISIFDGFKHLKMIYIKNNSI